MASYLDPLIGVKGDPGADGVSPMVTAANVLAALAMAGADVNVNGQNVTGVLATYPTPSAAVTTTDATATNIGVAIPIPVGASGFSVADIRFSLIGYDTTNGHPFALRRLLTVGRVASGSVVLIQEQILATDTLNAADVGIDTNGSLGATTAQIRVVGLAATTIRWRLFLHTIDLYG